MRLLVLAISMLFLIYTVTIELSSRQWVSADSLNQQGMSLLVQAEGDPQTLQSALHYLDRALDRSPQLASAQVHRIDVLLQLGRLPQALDAIDRLIAQTGDRQHRLLRCMLVEWVQPDTGDHTGCYRAVAEEVLADDNAQAVENSQYLLALKMMQAPDFEVQAERYLAGLDAEVTQNVQRQLLLETPREEVILQRLYRRES